MPRNKSEGVRHDSQRSVLTPLGLSHDSQRFVEDFQKETDRGAALAGAAFLDDALAALIRAAFVANKKLAGSLFEDRSPINSMAARADVAYCMGLIGPKMYSDLTIIRKVRNKFAHSHRPVSFGDSTIRRWCEGLATGRELLAEGTTPRLRFVVATTDLMGQLLLRGLSTKHAPEGADFRMATKEDDRKPS